LNKILQKKQETAIDVVSDASKEVYAAVSYLWFVYLDGSTEVGFSAAKVRVTPLRAISIPRLELMAAVVGVRLARIVTRSVVANFGQTVLMWYTGLKDNPDDINHLSPTGCQRSMSLRHHNSGLPHLVS
jgi:hypothetical protein